MLSKVMSSATLVFWILVGMILGVKTETPAVTLREVEEKINSLGKLEQNVERLVKEFSNLEEKTNNISEKLEGKLDIVDTLDKEVNNLTDSVSNLNKQITSSEREITKLQNELEYGGKNIPTYPHNMNSKYVCTVPSYSYLCKEALQDFRKWNIDQIAYITDVLS